MRRVLVIVALGALLTGACSDADSVSRTSLPLVIGSTAEPSSTMAVSPTTSTSTSAVPSTTFLGPTITYDPNEPRYGGGVVIADDQEPPTLNPYVPGGDNFIVDIVGQAHLASVYDIDPDSLELIPDAVVQIPTVGNGGVVLNDDGSMDVTWELLPEAQWADGIPISGEDLAFTLEYRQATTECSGYSFGPEPLPEYEVIAVDGKFFTARFPDTSLQHEMLLRWIVPMHAVSGSDYCDGWNDTMWPAGGPFVFAEWVHSGEYHHIRLVRNENYWKTNAAGNRLPYLDEVRIDFIPETESIISAFTNRRVDVIQPPPFVPEIPRDQWEAAGASVQLLPGPVWEHINFQFGPTNRNAESLNGYLEFRQAIAYGLDRRALLDDAGYEWLEVADGFLNLFTVAASSQPWSQYRYDPERARQLLAVACEKAERNCAANPPRVVYSTTSNADFRPRVADQIVEQLAAIGIIVELELEDSQLFFGETMTGGTWDVGNWAWVGMPGSAAIVEFLDLFAPDRPYREGDPAGRSRNYYAWGTPESSVAADDAVSQVQTLLDRLRSSADGAEVVSLARQIEEILAEQVVIIPLNARAVLGAVWADEIQGFRMNPTQAGHTWNIEQWYLVGE